MQQRQVVRLLRILVLDEESRERGANRAQKHVAQQFFILIAADLTLVPLQIVLEREPMRIGELTVRHLVVLRHLVCPPQAECFEGYARRKLESGVGQAEILPFGKGPDEVGRSSQWQWVMSKC